MTMYPDADKPPDQGDSKYRYAREDNARRLFNDRQKVLNDAMIDRMLHPPIPVFVSVGQYSVTLPSSSHEAKAIWKKLRKMVDVYMQGSKWHETETESSIT